MPVREDLDKEDPTLYRSLQPHPTSFPMVLWDKRAHSPSPSCPPARCREPPWQGRARLDFPFLQEDGTTRVPWRGHGFVCSLQTPPAVCGVFVETGGSLCCFPICKPPCKPVTPSTLETARNFSLLGLKRASCPRSTHYDFTGKCTIKRPLSSQTLTQDHPWSEGWALPPTRGPKAGHCLPPAAPVAVHPWDALVSWGAAAIAQGQRPRAAQPPQAPGIQNAVLT